MTAAARCNALSVVVSDMSRTITFYRACGLDLPADGGGEPHVEASGAGGFRIMFDTEETVRSFEPDWQPPTSGHRMSLAFECASVADVDATYDRLVELGATSHLAPFDAFWGQRYATVLDPDNNPVDLYAPLG